MHASLLAGLGRRWPSLPGAAAALSQMRHRPAAHAHWQLGVHAPRPGAHMQVRAMHEQHGAGAATAASAAATDSGPSDPRTTIDAGPGPASAQAPSHGDEGPTAPLSFDADAPSSGSPEAPPRPRRGRVRGGAWQRMSLEQRRRFREARRDTQIRRNRYERRQKEYENQRRARETVPQPRELRVLCEQLDRLNMRMRDAFPVRQAEMRGRDEQALHSQPEWRDIRAEAQKLLERVLAVLREEADKPPPLPFTLMTAQQWRVLLFACKNHALYSYALPLYRILCTHLLHPVPEKHASPAMMTQLAERQVNVLLECVARGQEQAAPGQEEAQGPAVALRIMRDMQKSPLAGHFAVTGGASGVLLRAFDAASAPAIVPDEAPATSAAKRTAHLEAMRTRYDTLQPKDSSTHSVMLGIYLAYGDHAAMRALLASLDAQGAPLNAGCMGAMLSSLYAQLEHSEMGSAASQALLQFAEKLWRRAKTLPHMDATVTAAMMRVCALMWDAERQQAVLMEAVQLEQEHNTLAQRRADAIETGSSPAFAPTAPELLRPSVGFIYANPSCFSLLLHTLLTRLPRPLTILPAARHAWDTLQRRYTQALEEKKPERARVLRPTSDVMATYAKLLKEAGQAPALLQLWRSLTRSQRAASPNILLMLLGELSRTGAREHAEEVAALVDVERTGWSTASLTAFLSCFLPKRSSVAAKGRGNGKALLADPLRAAQIWSRFTPPALAPSAHSYCVYMQLLVGTGVTDGLVQAEEMWEKMQGEGRRMAWERKHQIDASALRAAHEDASPSFAASTSSAAAPSSSPAPPSSSSLPPPLLHFTPLHYGYMIKAAHGSRLPHLVRLWSKRARQARCWDGMDSTAKHIAMAEQKGRGSALRQQQQQQQQSTRAPPQPEGSEVPGAAADESEPLISDLAKQLLQAGHLAKGAPSAEGAEDPEGSRSAGSSASDTLQS